MNSWSKCCYNNFDYLHAIMQNETLLWKLNKWQSVTIEKERDLLILSGKREKDDVRGHQSV